MDSALTNAEMAHTWPFHLTTNGKGSTDLNGFLGLVLVPDLSLTLGKPYLTLELKTKSKWGLCKLMYAVTFPFHLRAPRPVWKLKIGGGVSEVCIN